MTLRRLMVLILGLPRDSWTVQSREQAAQAALKPKAEQIRERAEHYRRQRELAAQDEPEEG